jgi:hypothetical protein
MMRRLDLEWPEHEEAADNTQYLLGDDLLVAPIYGNPAVVMTSADAQTPEGQPGFRGEYFANMTLAGEPAYERTEERIDFDWGYGNPAPGIPADKFSVQWTGKIGPLAKGGKALFAVTGDDGFRLRIDDELIIDQWWTRPRPKRPRRSSWKWVGSIR